MVVTVIAMRVVQMPMDQVIHMIAVGYWLMTAIRAVLMVRFMLSAVVFGRALERIGVGDVDMMLCHVISHLMMQMTIMQVVDMSIMLHGRMTTFWAVLMVMVCMMIVSVRHPSLLLELIDFETNDFKLFQLNPLSLVNATIPCLWWPSVQPTRSVSFGFDPDITPRSTFPN